ncbi:zinc finger protein 32 [Drosophila virilis]
MPNRAFNLMPTIKFSIHCVKMSDEALEIFKSSSNQKHSSMTAKPLEQQRHQTKNIATEKDVLRHMCEHCGYRTRIRGNLKVHKRRHTGEKPFRCNVCDASFAARYQLTTHNERHMDAHQRRSRYMCKDCNVGFLSARALYHHKPLHAESKQYKCALCDKSFAQAAGYAQHKRWHRQRYGRATATTSLKVPEAIDANNSN